MPLLHPPRALSQPVANQPRWAIDSLAKCIGACLLALWAPCALAKSVVDVRTSRQGDVIDVYTKATIKAPIEVVWATLTDYERLPDFIPGLKKSRVIARKGLTATVEQSGVARFLFLTVPIDVTVESTERPPNIEVRRVSGTLRQLQGRYETEVMPDASYVQLRWVGSIEPENRLPPLVGEALMRQSILSQFTGMVREIERREAARKRSAAAPPPIAPQLAPQLAPQPAPQPAPQAASPPSAPATVSTPEPVADPSPAPAPPAPLAPPPTTP
jgi:carbon monoxide dehydrogenase subunit G